MRATQPHGLFPDLYHERQTHLSLSNQTGLCIFCLWYEFTLFLRMTALTLWKASPSALPSQAHSSGHHPSSSVSNMFPKYSISRSLSRLSAHYKDPLTIIRALFLTKTFSCNFNTISNKKCCFLRLWICTGMTASHCYLILCTCFPLSEQLAVCFLFFFLNNLLGGKPCA